MVRLEGPQMAGTSSLEDPKIGLDRPQIPSGDAGDSNSFESVRTHLQRESQSFATFAKFAMGCNLQWLILKKVAKVFNQ